MSLLDTVLNAVKNVDLTPIEKAASSAYHNAASSVTTGTDSAYHKAAAGASEVSRFATEAYNNAGDFFERTRTHGEPDYVRGFVAGMIGGLVATGVKSIVDASLPTGQPQVEHDARLQVVEGAEELTGNDMNRNGEETAQQALNFVFGAFVGGIYGVIAEAAPAVQAPAGITFGAALWTAAHKIALPALGLGPSPLEEPVGKQVGQLGSHMAYGATVEMVRRGVRHAFDQEDLL